MPKHSSSEKSSPKESSSNEAPDSTPEHASSKYFPKAHPWRRPLLIMEFGALAVLLGSMFTLGRMAGPDGNVNPAWLLVPTLASLAVFVSFIGLMYLRWVANVRAEAAIKHKLIFAILTLTLLGIWAYGIAQTWRSL
ncbi:hypothetical protein RE428_06050 [Marinobacter nanhaiticus D15-8W]|nr:hypothetical protein [Marinobacter nanhaiticus]BES69587.1 hypothetical protein RE428_06050 [Marinobacter nanhaiticus D15-8W]